MRKAIFILVLLFSAYVCYVFGGNIPFSEQWSLFEALRTTSAIIFGVMGAWIAIVFPTALTNIFDKEFENKKEEVRKISRLLLPLSVSTAILAFVLLLGVVAPIVKQLPLIQGYIGVARGLSFSVLGVLTVVQLWTLLASLAPGESLLFEISKEEDKAKVLKRLQSSIKK